MIEFRCGHCGKILRAVKRCAGKTQRCPACKSTILVPITETPGSVRSPERSDAPGARPVDPAYDTDLLDVAPEAEVPDETANPCHASEEPAEDLRDSSGPRATHEAGSADAPRWPWPIDAILYPLNTSGLLHLVGLWLLLFFLCPSIMSTIGLGTEYVPIVYALPVAYTLYYLAECVRDRSGGGRHPPGYWMHPGDSSRWDCVTQALEMVGCVAMCFWPVSVYYIVRGQVDCAYWLLLAGGAFLFPMILLAVVLFDSLNALNPILIGGSILRTLIPYCGMVLLVCGVAVVFVRMGLKTYGFWRPPMVPFLLRLVQLYLIFVAIALLGGFYQRHETRLDWEV